MRLHSGLAAVLSAAALAPSALGAAVRPPPGDLAARGEQPAARGKPTLWNWGDDSVEDVGNDGGVPLGGFLLSDTEEAPIFVNMRGDYLVLRLSVYSGLGHPSPDTWKMDIVGYLDPADARTMDKKIHRVLSEQNLDLQATRGEVLVNHDISKTAQRYSKHLADYMESIKVRPALEKKGYVRRGWSGTSSEVSFQGGQVSLHFGHGKSSSRKDSFVSSSSSGSRRPSII